MSVLEKLPEVRIFKLVHGGRGLGQLPNGKKVFVWNALPGELVGVRLVRQQRTYDEAIAEKIIESSADRERPHEANYLDTSPWQIVKFEAENRYKKDITQELLRQHGIDVSPLHGTTHDDQVWQYRNKMEYGFKNEGNELHLALYERSSHNLLPVIGSKLAMPAIDSAANNLCTLLNKKGIKAEDLNSVIVRCSQDNDVAASLAIRTKSLPRIELPKGLKGLRVSYAQLDSSASKPKKELYVVGDCTLEDTLLIHRMTYDVDSFFQVNQPVFELALRQIKKYCQSNELVDMYAGVGSIGLNVANSSVDLVELNSDMAQIARLNAKRINLKTRTLTSSTEMAVECIVPSKPVIFDPPRQGLSNKVISRVLTVKPYKIAYLSCDPATQARDLGKLKAVYNIIYFEVFNFFPRTAHIETLAILTVK